MHLLVNGIGHRVTGEIDVPTSKYHAHRALILASLAEGVSTIRGHCDARHVHYTVQLLRGLGVTITRRGNAYEVHGLGGRYRPRRASVSAGSSGTTLYFMLGLASLADRPVTVTGQKYFRRRPVEPLLRALKQMGVELQSADNCPPVHIAGARPAGGHVKIPGTLSQWISGLILLAPFATGPSTIEVEGELNERTYLELTVAMMRQFGLQVTVSADWRRFDVEPDQQARPVDLSLPPDIGSAAFGVALAALHPSEVLLRGLTSLDGSAADHPEFHFLDAARAMGVPMRVTGGGTLIRQDAPRLRAIDWDLRDMPDMLPILSAMAAFADGESVFGNVAHTRLKESDRAAAMVQLNAMGAQVELSGNELRIRGVDRLRAARLRSYNDHRVLMSLAIAATRADGGSTLTYPRAYRISYPGFLDAVNGVGAEMSVPGRESEDVSRVTLPQWLRRRAQERADEVAVVDVRRDSDLVVTWGGLQDRVDRAAAMLLRLGVRRGDNVAYQLPNRIEFVVLSLAALRIGAVCCPIMPFFREREIAFVLGRARAQVLVVADRYRNRRPAQEVAGLSEQDRAGLRHLVVLSEADGTAELPDTSGLAVHDWDQALTGTVADRAVLDEQNPTPDLHAQLLFTSGTTGEPKGVLQPSHNLVRAAAMEIRFLGLGPDDAIWVPSPLAHQTGFLYGMVLALVLGVPQILQSEWNAKRALRSLNEHRATFVQAATPFLSDLVEAVEQSGDVPEHLRIFVATGATVPRTLAERATRVLDTAVCGAFGTTETCLGALATPDSEPAQRWGTDGRALDGVELRIVDDEGRAQPPGVEGNFELRSGTMFGGYLDRPGLTGEAFTPDGFYRTGDLATLDEHGYLRITGRVKDVINRGGEKIPVAEAEQLLFEHPAVADVAIVAMPDERLGERACAFVVLREGAELTFAQMQEYLDGRRMAKQYWPERLEAIEALPRNPIGKVQKFKLRVVAADLRPVNSRTTAEKAIDIDG
ncbi:3-phosphoshikimate 1-carboxyvinyltransferase [Actinoplanes sp. TFC3]|uniref:3-phosphoshikimate 1-carboxyvinyltransferase n=1 Tax=Actinoplanes sp. TFC3 TaxID=1710355 RepID=UPI00082D6E87|nr:3-phosphoshikimate 1-carboxyvinyltransferase [Actinoplanes sp. TFC3]